VPTADSARGYQDEHDAAEERHDEDRNADQSAPVDHGTSCAGHDQRRDDGHRIDGDADGHGDDLQEKEVHNQALPSQGRGGCAAPSLTRLCSKARSIRLRGERTPAAATDCGRGSCPPP